MDAQGTASQSTLAYCQAKLHSLTDLHEDIVTLVSGLQNHACSNCAKLSWKLMMSEIINAFSIEFIKREKEKMELLLQDIAAQTVANRSSFGGIERIKSRAVVVGRPPEISNEFVALMSRESNAAPSTCQHDRLIDKLNQVQAVYAELLHMLKGSEDYSTNDLPNQDLHKLVANLRRQNEELHVTLMHIKEQHYQQQLSESMEQRKRYLALQEETDQLRTSLTSESEAKKLRQEELQQTYKQLIEQQTKINNAEQERDQLSKQLAETNRRLEEVKSGFKVVYNAHKVLEKEHETLKEVHSQALNEVEVKSIACDVSQQEVKRLQQQLQEQSEQADESGRTRLNDYEIVISGLGNSVKEEQIKNSQLEEQLRELNGQLAATIEHRDNLNRDHRDLIEKYAQLEVRCSSALQDKEELAHKLQQMASHNDAENAILKQQVAELRAAKCNNSQETANAKREEYIEELHQMILELDSKLAEKTSMQTAMKAKGQFDIKKVNKLQKQVDQATAQVAHYQTKCEEIAAVVHQLQRALEQQKKDQQLFKQPLHPSTKRSATNSKILQLETENFDLNEECRQLKQQLEHAKSSYDSSLTDMTNHYEQTTARLVKENDYMRELIEQQERTINTTNLKLINEQAINQQYEKEMVTLKQMIQQEKTRGSLDKENLRTSFKILTAENKKLVEKYSKLKAELKARDKLPVQQMSLVTISPPPPKNKRRPSTPKKMIVKKELSAVVKKEKPLEYISDDDDHSGPSEYDIVAVKKECKK